VVRRQCIRLPKIFYLFGSETDLISLLILLLFLFVLGLPLQKKPIRIRRFKSDRDDIWQDCSSDFDLTFYFLVGVHDVLSHRKVLSSGE